MLGISTCWWNGRSLDGHGILDHVARLGLRGVELEYRLSASVLDQMRPHLKGPLTVLSIHNFFPNPGEPESRAGSGDYFLLSSPDPDEQAHAVKYTLRTLAYASELGAKAVVLHLGHVEMADPQARFFELHRAGQVNEPEGRRFLVEQTQIRNARRDKYLHAVLRNLEPLNREAERLNVTLGIENRCHFHEIPDLDEVGLILDTFRGGRVSYWHDVGHAAIQEALCICSQSELLASYAEHLAGIHLHDVNGLEDHLAPGKGNVDFGEILETVPPEAIKILELHPKVKEKDLRTGLDILKHLLDM
jgi:sugar phosphate isomerase/epimerase